MKYGTLRVYLDDKGQQKIEITAEAEVELAISRLIPTHRSYPLTVTAHAENAQLIRMVMSEYPLNITTPEKWDAVLHQIKKLSVLASTLQTLTPIEPSSQHFTGKLMPFQKLGLDFLLKTQGIALLADEMGLGKTVQSLAFIAEKPDSVPVLVVAPLVTLENWRREIEKFLKIPATSEFDGTSSTTTPRIQLIRSGADIIRPAEFHLINYELVHKHVKNLTTLLNPRLIIFDEIQNLRNSNTRKVEACTAIASHSSIRYRLGLSGTPVYNRGIEMYGIADIIKPGILGDRSEFVRRYCTAWAANKTPKEKQKTLSSLLQKSIMLRRKKSDVLNDLPDKTRLQQNIPIDTELYQEQLYRLYQKIESAKNRLAGSNTEEEEKSGLFELNKQVREMRLAERQIAGLAKAPHIINYVNALLADYPDEKFVIFCHHRSVHTVLFEGLWRFNPVQIIGGQKDDHRQKAIDDFQTKKECRVIICGLRAGNIGINLTSAAYVIFAELDWTPAVHRQAEDRLHRIGQKRKVFAHYLVGSGTFDDVLTGILVNKTVEIGNVMGDKLESLDNEKALKMLESRFKGMEKKTRCNCCYSCN